MSILLQVSQIKQVSYEKENTLKPKTQLQSKDAQLIFKPSSATSGYGQFPTLCALPNNQMFYQGILLMQTKGTKIDEKERALALVHSTPTIPKRLHLKVGMVKELADGVFVKKKSNGVLELYISEE